MSCFPILYWSFRFTWSQSSRMCEKKNPPDSNFKWLQPDETLYRPRVYTVIRSHQVRSFKIKSQNMHWNVKRRCRRGRGVLSQGVRNEGKLSQTLRNTNVAVKFLLRDVAPIQVHTQVVSCPRRSSHTLENVSDLLKKKKRGNTWGFFCLASRVRKMCGKSSAGLSNLRPIFKSDFAHVSQRPIMNPKPHDKQREPLPPSSNTTHQTPRCVCRASCSAAATTRPVSKPSPLAFLSFRWTILPSFWTHTQTHTHTHKKATTQCFSLSSTFSLSS